MIGGECKGCAIGGQQNEIICRWPRDRHERKRNLSVLFAVTQNTELDAKALSLLFDKEKFIVKITPIHQTANALQHGYDITTTYDKYDVYSQFEEPLLEHGWDVIVFVPSKEEDEDRITCGNALLADMGE